MLLYGFVYEAATGTFDEPSMMAVTASGYRLTGGGAEPVRAERDDTWKLSRYTQQRLAEDVTLTQQRRESTGPTRMIEVDDPVNGEWDRCVADFIAAAVNGDGVGVTPEEFGRRCTPIARAQTSDSATAIALPSGDLYRPRRINGVLDVEVIRAANRAGQHVELAGPAGTGKTTLALAAFGGDCEVLHCYEGMAREDLVGALLPVPGHVGDFGWVDGPLLRAMLDGRPLLIDEAGWMPPGLQALLHSAMDDTRTVTVLDRPEQQQVTAVAGFSVVCTLNPGLGFGLTDPVQDRIGLSIAVPADLEMAVDLGVPPLLLQLARVRQQRAEQTGDHTVWVPSLRELVSAATTESVFGINFAASALASKCPSEQREEFADEAARLLASAPEPLTALAP